ncbi:M20/M25/M40 family metallo-hydrolase [Streptomyces sp. NPDC093088]|uniref:M20/M25/M40 family metallo-hydrolase n=1 Tax=Streptomyces sp. NPDC093088 TaxID=3366023 RepID=UPI0038235322
MGSEAMHEELDARAAGVAERVVAWRHHLHRHPELSNREVNTARLVADHLRALGLDEVRTGIAGHGVVGVLRGGAAGERVVALRADTDALPVRDLCGADFASDVVDADYPGGPFPVSHACGHDCHTAMLLGAATAAAEYLQPVPPVHNSGPWVAAGLPTFRRVAGEGRVVETGGTLGYDDVSEFIRRFGGLYVTLGVQDAALDASGRPVPVEGGRGLVTNHNPGFYADDSVLVTGVRLHAHVAYDHLRGALVTREETPDAGGTLPVRRPPSGRP